MPRIKEDPIGRRDALTEAYEKQQADATIEALQIKAGTELARDAMAVGMTTDSYSDLLRQMTPEARARFMSERTTVGNFGEHFDEGVWRDDAAQGVITGTIFKNKDKDALARQIARHEERMYHWLWDPPVGGKHHKQSRFHVNAIQDALRQGFSAKPYAPIAEPGPVICDYVSPLGEPCPKEGFPDQVELDLHQSTKHRQWYQQREAARLRDRDRMAVDIQQQQVEINRQMLAFFTAQAQGGNHAEQEEPGRAERSGRGRGSDQD